MTTSTFDVPDITCDHCKTSIEGSVQSVAGVREVTVDVESKTVAVSHDEAIAVETVVAAIEEQGYEVSR